MQRLNMFFTCALIRWFVGAHKGARNGLVEMLRRSYNEKEKEIMKRFRVTALCSEIQQFNKYLFWNELEVPKFQVFSILATEPSLNKLFLQNRVYVAFYLIQNHVTVKFSELSFELWTERPCYIMM